MDVDIQKIFNSMSQITELTNQPVMINKEDEIVAFIGATKSGKSTLINCLLGNKLRVIENEAEGDFTLEQIDENSEPKIGTGAESETWIPRSYGVVPGTPWQMWDFPGFEDNKGIEREIAHAINIQQVLKRAKGVRFVLCVPFTILRDDNPMPFFKQLNLIRSISNNISNSLCIVSTKAEKGNLQKLLKKLSEAKLPDLSEDYSKILTNAQNVLKVVLKNESFFDFRSPCSFKNGDEYKMKDKNKLAEPLGKTCAVSLIGSKMSLSDGAKLHLRKVYAVLFVHWKHCNDVYVDALNDYKDKEIAKALKAPFKIEYLSKLEKTVEDIQNLPDVKDMVYGLGPLLSDIDTNGIIQFINTVQFFENLFRDIQKDNNYFKCIQLFENNLKTSLCGVRISFKKHKDGETKELEKIMMEYVLKKKEIEDENNKHWGTKALEYVQNNWKSLIVHTAFNAAMMAVPWANIFTPLGVYIGVVQPVVELTVWQSLLMRLPWH